MLSEEALERLSERLSNRIEQLNTYMIKKLARQIREIGTLTPSQVREVFQSIKYGNDIDEIMQEISKINNMNVKDIYEIFEEVAKKNQEYAKQFYDYRNIKFIPYEENKALQELVMSIATVTANNYMNIARTGAFALLDSTGNIKYTPLSKIYQKITDEAILNVSMGRESYEQQMKKTIIELSKQGIQDIDYASGYHRRMDSSVRMNMSDGIKTLYNELQSRFGEEFGSNGKEVTHHINSAPDHINTIDGKQFVLIDKVQEQISKGLETEIKQEDIRGNQVKIKGKWYDDFNIINKSLKRKVSELNCHHIAISIIVGISKPQYTQEQLDEDAYQNNVGFEFEGKHYTNYEGTQLQRRIETKIRQYKDRQIGAKELHDDDEVQHCEKKIKQLTEKYKELSDVSGLPTKVERLRVYGYRKVSIKNSNSDNYRDVTEDWLGKKSNGITKATQLKIGDTFNYKNNSYIVDNRTIKNEFSKDEINFADFIQSRTDKKVILNPTINYPEGIKTADLTIGNIYADMKLVSGNSKQLIYHNVRNKMEQATCFFFEASKSDLNIQDLIDQVNKVFKRNDTNWVKTIGIKKDKTLIILKNNIQKKQ